MPIRLFAYGTLQIPEILAHVLGRRCSGIPARLEGYARFRLRDKAYPAVLEQPGGSVAGVVYTDLTPEDLERLDEYEGELYERRALDVSVAGRAVPAQTYVLREPYRELLSPDDWDLAAFRNEHLAQYLEHLLADPRAP